MAYVKRTSIAGDLMLVKYYHTGRYHPRDERRERKVNQSPESVKQANIKRATENLLLKLSANFAVDDQWVTLTYRKANKSRTLEQMNNDIQKFIRGMRREYKKLGKDFKFVYALRVGSHGARHFHLVINEIDKNFVYKHWPHGIGKVAFIHKGDGFSTFEKIAGYLIKDSETTRETFGNENLKRYSCSRNLEKPIVKKQVIKRLSTFKQKPTVPKGWTVIIDSEKLSTNIYGHIQYEFKCERMRN